MAAPQRRPVARPPLRRPTRGRQKGQGRSAWSLRTFVVLVVVPVALMLGSVYTHTVAAGLGTEAARIEAEKAAAEAEGERLEVRIAELSESGSIRESAEEDLGMRDPSGKDLKTYNGSEGEDVANGGEESKEGTGE